MSRDLSERRKIILQDSHSWPDNGLPATEHDCRILLDQIRELIVENRMLETGRDEARAVARRLDAQHQDTLHRVTLLQHEAERLLGDRDYAMATCTLLWEQLEGWPELFDLAMQQRNAARAALAAITAEVRPVVDAAEVPAYDAATVARAEHAVMEMVWLRQQIELLLAINPGIAKTPDAEQQRHVAVEQPEIVVKAVPAATHTIHTCAGCSWVDNCATLEDAVERGTEIDCPYQVPLSWPDAEQQARGSAGA